MNVSELSGMKTACLVYFWAVGSGCSHRPAGGAANQSKRQGVRAGADHFWVQQSSHQSLCVIAVAPMDRAAQRSPSPGEGLGGYCEGMEELHWEGRRETYLLVIKCKATSYVCHKVTTLCKTNAFPQPAKDTCIQMTINCLIMLKLWKWWDLGQLKNIWWVVM